MEGDFLCHEFHTNTLFTCNVQLDHSTHLSILLQTMPEVHCTACSLVFDSLSKRNTHFLDCSNRAEHILTINHQQVTVTRTVTNGQQYWRCCCGGSSCKSLYAKWNTLKKHITTTKPMSWNVSVSLPISKCVLTAHIILLAFHQCIHHH